MAPKTKTESNAAAQRRLTEEMLNLGQSIDKQQSGSPKRLEMLRREAALSDKREALRSTRV
jgi:hypothetical protein